MNDKPVAKWMLKWALPIWTGGAIVFGIGTVYGLARGSFEWTELAIFVFFAAIALDTWRKRRKRDQGREKAS